MLWLIYEFIMQIKIHMRVHFSWQEVMFVQIFLCLACTSSLTHSQHLLYAVVGCHSLVRHIIPHLSTLLHHARLLLHHEVPLKNSQVLRAETVYRRAHYCLCGVLYD